MYPNEQWECVGPGTARPGTELALESAIADSRYSVPSPPFQAYPASLCDPADTRTEKDQASKLATFTNALPLKDMRRLLTHARWQTQ